MSLLQNSVVNLPAKHKDGREISGKTQIVNKSYLCVECNISSITKRVNYIKIIEKTKEYYY